ncbi:CG33262 [Drosophila busckii]|uniref:CG33262 n=1 Tax=Drosophila busckii TaxID=30019 RepID=A0A0M4EI31_DROBS|nr:CG33262 [Drosophila busckii]
MDVNLFYNFLVFITLNSSSAQKRFLIFPRQAPTRHQFIAGIGIPADLSYESLTVGHVLKAEFFLPYNATVFRQNLFLPQYKHTGALNQVAFRNMLTDTIHLRWQIYAFLEHLLNSYGYNGHECILQTICGIKLVGFAKEFSVVNELLHLLLSPSTSINSQKDIVYDYTYAETSNARRKNCDIYSCKLNLLNWISKIL